MLPRPTCVTQPYGSIFVDGTVVPPVTAAYVTESEKNWGPVDVRRTSHHMQ